MAKIAVRRRLKGGGLTPVVSGVGDTVAERVAMRDGARRERRAVRDAVRRELRKVKYFTRKYKGQAEGLRWVLGWLGGRIERTRRPGGVGR